MLSESGCPLSWRRSGLRERERRRCKLRSWRRSRVVYDMRKSGVAEPGVGAAWSSTQTGPSSWVEETCWGRRWPAAAADSRSSTLAAARCTAAGPARQ